ncbi:hypothetical protein DFA_10738 [Cavenderia fasciculata]|uniref:Uncharacterized protein n=1 Tax=Cavenderia fasciculata TaxID=261658 RepID=F4QB93_CACFS|nr:uncharacterized protein DFA_10738 [Cavenderia fasciculata]EGG14865.1 hypothetical protein DFA_10738 [Cavenderia fasciculata]|eukprot:XP_004351381.1 hypothetical protein DFA_10738 [Cavenderia fasciculata]
MSLSLLYHDPRSKLIQSKEAGNTSNHHITLAGKRLKD